MLAVFPDTLFEKHWRGKRLSLSPKNQWALLHTVGTLHSQLHIHMAYSTYRCSFVCTGWCTEEVLNSSPRVRKHLPRARQARLPAPRITNYLMMSVCQAEQLLNALNPLMKKWFKLTPLNSQDKMSMSFSAGSFIVTPKPPSRTPSPLGRKRINIINVLHIF